MMLESKGNYTAHDFSNLTYDDSYGCMQVNRYGVLASVRPSPSYLLNPINNAQYAYGLYKAVGWQAWHNSAVKLGLL